MKAYKYSIHPVPDPTFWPHGVDVSPTLLPPVIKRMPGRPKKSRRKEQAEEPNAVRRSNIVKCKVCNELGHNRRTCSNIQNSGRDSDLHVPLSQLARKRKTPPLAGRKRKAAVISSSQPPAPAQVSSSQPPAPVQVSSSQPQPPSHLGGAYQPSSFWRGIGVSPQREIRSKNTNDAKGAKNYEVCTQQ
ncbi:hypothetical protein Salat_0919400 [Sesamum alatum]|uniref:Uncharacterized protein n=1 Tax=Sesamum alatum TaxID=300844 RepID=A0AAE1YKC0_9LAMI|nr:hypothetical protein Salat_0919400 [Sesamum alatum]